MLTHKQNLFVIKYIECGNASEAYRFAYNCSSMKPETVNRNAKACLDNNKIAARIKELQADIAHKLLVSDESVLREFARIGFADLRKVFDEHGNILNPSEWDDDTAAAVQSFRINPDGSKVIKLAPKTEALKALAKNLGLFEKDNRQKGESAMTVAEAIAAAQREAERRDRDA